MSNYFKLLLVACVVGFGAFSAPLAATTYYVDSDTGNDANSGTSPEQAWASLSKVNGTVLGAGDMVLFKADTRYIGQLKPQGSGTPESPIIIDMYGHGYRPRIDADGLFLNAVHIYNVECYEISNLEVTNLAPQRMLNQAGVRITADDCGEIRHIHLKNLFVHDVNGDLVKAKSEGHGITFEAVKDSGNTLSWFDDLLIEDCHVLRTDRNGICGRTEWNNRDISYHLFTNVVVRGNLVEDVGGDGIKMWGTDHGLCEYNIVRNGRQRCADAAAGIWPYTADDTVIQFNEVSGMKGTTDGQGFDCDYNGYRNIIQYNYSHDNEGGFSLICGPEIKKGNVGNWDSVIRYNVSENDHCRIFHISGESPQNTMIYNNIIYVGPDDNIPLIMFDNWGGEYPTNTQFYNNIFYVDGSVTYENMEMANGYTFEGNVFYGNHIDPPYDPCAITSDPMLVNPGQAPAGMYSLDDYYKLDPNSPCIDSGVLVADNGGMDRWGNPVPTDITDRGVHEFQDVEPDTNAPTPDPTWAKQPYATRDSAVAMAATMPYDPSGVQYYFTCTAGGGHDSGWQNSPIYEDTYLVPDSEYTYTVKARDKSSNNNETAASSPASAVTLPQDTTPPEPDPMTWVTTPYGFGEDTIMMESAHAYDQSNVEFYFECVGGAGHDSGWQDAPIYTDTGLEPNTTYTYTVTARDKSYSQNETAASTAESGTTLGSGGAPSVYVYDIEMGYRYTGLYYAQATVWIKNNSGLDMDAAMVSCTWTGEGVRESEDADATGEDGKIMFESLATKKGTFVFTVTDVVRQDYIYDPNLNNETSDTITFPIE